MPFTGQLGTSSSQLGNIELGHGAGPATNLTASNTLVFTGTASATVVHSRTATNTIVYTGSAVRVKTASASNAYAPTNNVGFQQSRPASNAITYSQTVAFTRIINKTVVAGYVYSHSLGMNKKLTIPANNLYAPVESTSGRWSKSVSNTIVYTGTAVGARGKSIFANWNYGYALTYTAKFTRKTANVFGPFQAVSTRNYLHINVSNTLVQTQTVLAPKVRSGTNVLVFTQTLTVTKATPVKSIAIWNQSAVIQMVKSPQVFSLYVPKQTLYRALTKVYKPFNAFGMNQQFRKTKVITTSASNFYAPIGDVVKVRNLLTVVSNFIPVGVATALKVIPRTASNVFAPVNTAAVKSVKSLAASNQLVFLPNRTIYFPVGNLGTLTVPNLVMSQVKTLQVQAPPITVPGPNGPMIVIPQSVQKAPPYCTLQVPERAITLPAPEFNDSEAYAGLFTIRRAMNGGTVTYVHRLGTDKMKYNFSIGVRKAFELENYLQLFNSRIHTLTNWKGEIWYAFITNNPMDLIAKRRFTNGLGDVFDDREELMVTLEFEGTRIN